MNDELGMGQTPTSLGIESLETPPEVKKELTDRGKEVVRLWQRCKAETDPAQRRKLAIEFYEKLKWATTPEMSQGETDNDVIAANNVTKSAAGSYYSHAGADSLIAEILEKESVKEIGTGTSGERIIFRKANSREKNPSTDGKIRWMAYPDPTTLYPDGTDQRYQKRVWWSAFVKTFGTHEVDLTQKVD